MKKDVYTIIEVLATLNLSVHFLGNVAQDEA
jgi:hypothetical protein